MCVQSSEGRPVFGAADGGSSSFGDSTDLVSLHREKQQAQRPDSMQLAAISSDAPATLLVAAAGTGKTRVLAARLAHVLRGLEAQAEANNAPRPKPSSVLVMSFTSAAAEQVG